MMGKMYNNTTKTYKLEGNELAAIYCYKQININKKMNI